MVYCLFGFSQTRCADDGNLPQPYKKCFLKSDAQSGDTTTISIPEGCTDIKYDSLKTGIYRIVMKGFHGETYLHCIANVSDGKRSGKYLEFYKSGLLYSKSYFLKGHLTGPFISYHKNGFMRSNGEITYHPENDEELFTGTYFEYWENGAIASKFLVKKNKIRKELYLDEQGKIISYDTYLKTWHNCY
tara:strand:+ start:201 stop:764 length:564 start_codon:yes stop_codon:yes gene_type:complete